MAQQKKDDNDGWGIFFAITALLVLSLSWMSIPSETEINNIQIVSFAFVDGIIVGWADEAYIRFFHEDDPINADAASNAFRAAVLKGESEFPLVMLGFLVLGTLFSIGGLIALWFARTADTIGNAFTLGFWAEIAEAVAYHVGASSTTGNNSFSWEAAVITLAVAVFMGFVAKGIWKRHNKQ
jgi:hypothetical protein